MAGKVDVVSLMTSDSVIRTPLGSISPVISVSGDAPFASLDINASLKRIKVKADVGVVRVTVMFPSASGIDAKLLRQLLKNLLKPSIDLDSLAKGDIVISPNTGKSGEAEDFSEKSTDDPSKEKTRTGTENQLPSEAIGHSPHSQKMPPAGGPGVRLAFSSGDTPVRVADNGNIMYGDSPYLVRSIDKKGMVREGWFPVRVRVDDTVRALRSSAQDALSLVSSSSAFQLEDDWYILMCRGTPCAANTFLAEPISLNGRPVSPNAKPKTVPAIAGFVGIDEGAWELKNTLPRLVQRALRSGDGPEIACATSDAGVCTAAIFRLQGEQLWSYFPSSQPYSVTVNEGSLWHRALTRLPIAQAMQLIDMTRSYQIFALAAGPNDQLRALMKRSNSIFGGSLRLFGIQAPPTSSDMLLEVSNNEAPFNFVPLKRFKADDNLSRWPWSAFATESPLDNVLRELSASDLTNGLSVAANDKGDRATIQVQTPVGDESRLVFAMSYQNRVCTAVAKTSAEIGTILDSWLKPASFTDTQAGRIRQGADLETVRAALPRLLLGPDSVEPFLIDPLFAFYPSGGCL